MHIKVNMIDMGNYNIGILKEPSSHKSMLFTMLCVIFIIPREICNMDILLHVCIIFQIPNKRSFFQNSKKKLKFLTHPYINIENFFFIFNMRFFKYYWSHTYIKFYNLYMHKTSYTFILIFKHFFLQCLPF